MVHLGLGDYLLIDTGLSREMLISTYAREDEMDHHLGGCEGCNCEQVGFLIGRSVDGDGTSWDLCQRLEGKICT